MVWQTAMRSRWLVVLSVSFALGAAGEYFLFQEPRTPGTGQTSASPQQDMAKAEPISDMALEPEPSQIQPEQFAVRLVDRPPIPQQILPELGEIERYAALERRFVAELVDESWAPRVEGTIYTYATDSGLGFAHFQAQCRTTMCRVDIVLAQAERRRDAGAGFRQIYLSVTKPLLDSEKRFNSVSRHTQYVGNDLRADALAMPTGVLYLHFQSP